VKVLLDTHAFIWWDAEPNKRHCTKNPFDPLLIAQAVEEQATLVSADSSIAQYQVNVL
jgi:PIN domain nuclease of toxin-antitoxin system